MSLLGSSFQQVVSLQQPFTLPLGRMLVANGAVPEEAYVKAGEAQQRTIVIAKLYDLQPELRPVILSAFPNRDFTDIDLNGAMFKYSTETILDKLDEFLHGLNVSDLDNYLQAAKAEVDAEKGVHPKAASSAVIHKALFLKGMDGNAVVNASLAMQMATRGLGRAALFEQGLYNGEGANSLLQLHNKMNFKFDPLPLRAANRALIGVTSIEMEVADELERTGTLDPAFREASDVFLRRHIRTMIEAMPYAIGVYHTNKLQPLETKAVQVYDANKAILDGKLILQLPKTDNADQAVSPASPVSGRTLQ